MRKLRSQINVRIYFLTTFSVIALWRTVCFWRENINQFHQDEIVWHRDSTSHSFLEFIQLRDSGYPTPLLRAILWLVSRTLDGNPTYIHILAVVIAALCCTSVLMLKGFSKRDLVFAAIAMGSFPSADLLLWHNLSYFGLIPIMVFFLNGFAQDKILDWKIVVTQVLILFSSKPQLLIVYLMILFLLSAKQSRQKNSLVFLYLACSILPIYLLVVGRQNSNSLELQISSRAFLIGLIALMLVPIALTLPAVFVGFSGILRAYSQPLLVSLLELALVAVQSLYLFLKRDQVRLLFNSERKQIILLSAVPLYISLFIFGNSTWGNDLFWKIPCTECLLQRHIYPLMVLSVFTFLQIRNSKSRVFLLCGLSVQYMALGTLAYPVLFDFK